MSYYLFWTWHRGPLDMPEGVSVGKFSLSESQLDTKLHALGAYASQFEHADGQPILSPQLLMPARRSYEVYIR